MAEGSRPDLSLHQVGRIHVLTRAFALLSSFRSLLGRPNGPGGESGVVPPVPMPNTAVKRSSADDTRVIKPWENRPVPGPFGRSRSGVKNSCTGSRIGYTGAYRRGVEQW